MNSLQGGEYMVYAQEMRRAAVRAGRECCPMANFVVRVLGVDPDGAFACRSTATRLEFTLQPGKLRPANKFERTAGLAAELAELKPERGFRRKPEPLAVGRWSVEDLCARTGLHDWTIYGIVNKAGMKVSLNKSDGAFKARKMLRYTDANRIIDACVPPKGWCTRRQATEMTGLDKTRLDRSGARTMQPPKLPGAPKAPWYNIEDLQEVRRVCAVYGRCVPPRAVARTGVPAVDVEVPRGATATEHIALIRKAVDGRRGIKVNIRYK